MLEVKLFGTGSMRYSDRSLSGFPNQQAYLLLCYLLLNRQYPQCRERLASVFWGECPTAVARKNLRNVIWRLRQVMQGADIPMDAYLFTGEDTVSFMTSSRYWLDVEEFETKVSEYQDLAGQELLPEQASGLEVAADLFVGDLMEGIYEDWCLLDRERFGLMYLNALSKLMAFHEHNRTYEQGLICGERILARDHTRERVHRRMMRLHWGLGDRNAALEQYKRCVQILRDELGIHPVEETHQMYEQIAHDTFDSEDRSMESEDVRLINQGMGTDALPPLAEHIMQKLERLESMTEQNRSELQRIRRLLGESLVKSQFPSPDSL